MKISERSYQPEWLDLGLPYYTEQEYRDCLYQLDKVGRILGGDSSTFSIFKKMKLKRGRPFEQPLRVKQTYA